MRRPGRRRPRALLSAMGTLFAVLSLPAPPASFGTNQGVPESGKLIYEERCVSCHGKQGKGDGPEAPYLSPRPASLVSAATSVKSDRELLAAIADGKPRTAMPAWKHTLTDQQQRDVLAYLRSLVRFYKPGTPAPLPPDQAN